MKKGLTNNYVLWTVQGLLAALFLFAGVMKLVLPAQALTQGQGPSLPVPFLRFIGVAETLGAIGLILPWLLRIRPGLTPLAAVGLVIIMIGATVLNLAGGSVVPTLISLIVGLLSAFVAYGRSALRLKKKTLDLSIPRIFIRLNSRAKVQRSNPPGASAPNPKL